MVGADHHLEKIEVINENPRYSEKDQSRRSDTDGSESSDGRYNDSDAEGSVVRENENEGEELEMSAARKDSHMIHLIKKVTQGDLGVNESFEAGFGYSHYTKNSNS